MSLVHAKIRIDAPIGRVWDLVMDPYRLEQWVTIHRALRDVSPGPLRKGSTMEQVMHLRGFSFHVHWTLKELNPPTHAEWHGQGPAHSHARIRYRLTGDDGGTEFEYLNDFTAPGGRLGTIASKVIVGAASEREAQASLRRLKALLETD